MTRQRASVRRISRKKHLLFGLVTVGLVIVLGLPCLEAIVRMNGPSSTPQSLRRASLLYEPAVLARHMMVPHQTLEDPPTRVNAQGYRGDDFRVEKSPGTVRIMFLGGSMVWSIQMPDGEDWPSLTGARLQELGFEQVEVMNVGIPGHASWDSLGRFYGELWTYHPDFVVICHGWNDLKLVKDYEEDGPLLRWAVPYRPKPNPHTTYRNAVDRLLAEHSELYLRVRTRYLRWKYPAKSEGVIRSREPLRNDYSGEVFEQLRLDLNLIVDAVRHAGATPVFVTQPTLAAPGTEGLDATPIRYDYVGLTHEALIRAFQDYREMVKALAAEREVPVVDPFDEITGRPEYFLDHVHLSPEGNQKISRLVSDGLAPLLAPASGGS